MRAHLRDDIVGCSAAHEQYRHALLVSRLLGLVLVMSSVVFTLDRAHATIAGWWWLAAGIAFALAWRAERQAASRLAHAVDKLVNAVAASGALDSGQPFTVRA